MNIENLMNIDTIKADKERIVKQMHAEFESTDEADRYFTKENIRDCATDLENYITLLQCSQQSDNKQKEIAEAIKSLFDALSTFKEEDEYPEYLWGFIYNGYTVDLTDFIMNTAFAFGFQKDQREDILTKHFHIKHHPHSFDTFRIYIGADEDRGIMLDYNKQKGSFEYLENPYGDPYGIPIFDLKINSEGSQLSFDILTAGVFKTINLKAQRLVDRVLLKVIGQLSLHNIFSTSPNPDFCAVELGLNNGIINQLNTLNYDLHNRIINMFTEGAGMKVFVQELDEKGMFRNSDNLTSHPEIITKKFVIVDAVPDWKYYEVGDLKMDQNMIIVQTKNMQYEYETDARDNVVAIPVSERQIQYTLKTYDFIINMLQEILQLRVLFKSRCTPQ